jgi:transcriptional/translational regulatory protein YebC/TACO1
MSKKLEKNINNFLSTDIEWIPINNIEISKEEKDDVVKFLEILEDDDDVQNIYTNLKF